tara:strand:- start:2549 stop:2914 length:366 start_codon:yes stop_codon:yes gene_type:complete
MALAGKEQQLSRGLAGRVSEVGTPPPKEAPPPKNIKGKRTFSDIGQGLIAAAPLLALAVPGLGAAALIGITGASMIGSGLARKSRGKLEGKISGYNERAATAASTQTGREAAQARESERSA